MLLCVLARFKNESHIMYEWINHYLEEGVDHFILIDDNSDDDYLKSNAWLNNLIKLNKVSIKKSEKDFCPVCTRGQRAEYDLHLKEVKKYDWVAVCDMDEFFFSMPLNSTLKTVLNTTLSKYDYIMLPWKLFNHTHDLQPKSVIDNNVYTHSAAIDLSSPSRGYKYIVKTKKVKSLGIHDCQTLQKTSLLKLKDCHNLFIQNNHYRTQSEEFLRGVKAVRAELRAGVGDSCPRCKRSGKKRRYWYENYSHNELNYDKHCSILQTKRKGLIKKILKLPQVRPKVHKESSYYNPEAIQKIRSSGEKNGIFPKKRN
jgi:hypothetical protein